MFVKDGRPVTFALLGLIEFKTLDELFAYIDREAGRWSFPSAAARQAFGDGLLRRGVESRLVSMTYEKPLELLLTHTREELEEAVAGRPARTAPVFTGRSWRLDAGVYRQAFVDVQAALEDVAELLERRAHHPGARPLELVPDRGGHRALRRDSTIPRSISGRP